MSVFDIVICGSGAGAGPMAAVLAEAGHKVLVLEKGPRYATSEFVKDEIAITRRPTMWPHWADEPQVQATRNAQQAGSGAQRTTHMFWNGSLVGGSSMLMSGFFLRMKPEDFKPLSTFGPIPLATVADWPISYDELEPWYDRVEKEVGVSGRLRDMPATLTDRRSSADFPMPPTREHPFADQIDEAATHLGLHPMPLPRAVLSRDRGGRKACDYNGYCGSYACATKAKGGSLHAWIERAEATGNCEVRSRAMVYRLESDQTGAVKRAHYFDRNGTSQTVDGRIFVVACQAIESARLLLASPGPKHPHGLANSSGEVGRNLVFCTFGAGWADFPYGRDRNTDPLRSKEPFVNRVIQDYYYFDPGNPWRNAGNTRPERGMWKAGTINFLLVHPNPIAAAYGQAVSDQRPSTLPLWRESVPLWGKPLKRRLAQYFTEVQHLRFETFSDWLPHRDSSITLDTKVKDKWGLPVSHIRAFNHYRSRRAVDMLVEQGKRVLWQMGARNLRTPAYGGPSVNLMGGTCRFGDDPAKTVLNRDCRAHDVPNLYVTDGSFMPTAGSVPFTFTIYANSLRVAHHLKKQLGS